MSTIQLQSLSNCFAIMTAGSARQSRPESGFPPEMTAVLCLLLNFHRLPRVLSMRCRLACSACHVDLEQSDSSRSSSRKAKMCQRGTFERNLQESYCILGVTSTTTTEEHALSVYLPDRPCLAYTDACASFCKAYFGLRENEHCHWIQ